MTHIMQCNCQHPFQDQRYGLGQRVHNHTESPAGWRCTVCNKNKGEKITEKSEKKEEKKK